MDRLIPQDVVIAFREVLNLIPTVREAVAGDPEVIHVRPGYDDALRPAIVVMVIPGLGDSLAARLAHIDGGFPIIVAEASVEEQLAAFFPDDAGRRGFSASQP